MKRFKSYAKLRAIHTQTVQPIATRAHVQVLDHALLCTGISLRGYPSSLQSFRCAQYQNLEESRFYACPDPRTHQTSVFDALEQELVSYINQCKKDGVAPEIWLANHSETILIQKHAQWFSMLEHTALTKSYKMVSLAVLIGAQAIHSGMELERFLFSARDYLLRSPLLRYDVPRSIQNTEQWKRYFLRWVASSWSQGKKMVGHRKRKHTHSRLCSPSPHERFCRYVDENHSI